MSKLSGMGRDGRKQVPRSRAVYREPNDEASGRRANGARRGGAGVGQRSGDTL